MVNKNEFQNVQIVNLLKGFFEPKQHLQQKAWVKKFNEVIFLALLDLITYNAHVSQNVCRVIN